MPEEAAVALGKRKQQNKSQNIFVQAINMGAMIYQIKTISYCTILIRKRGVDMLLYVIIGIVVLLLLWLIVSYNGFIKLSANCEEGFATMDVYLKKRI